ncbi:MAG TPA: hypothetical protein EYP91_14580 [Gammaproteobacteria bacterium]|nr:hypothetical protein [Gammaproteobacteria bacterium]
MTLAFTLTFFFAGAFLTGAFLAVDLVFVWAFAFALFFGFAFAVALRFAAIDLSVSTKWVLKRAANLTR